MCTPEELAQDGFYGVDRADESAEKCPGDGIFNGVDELMRTADQPIGETTANGEDTR